VAQTNQRTKLLTDPPFQLRFIISGACAAMVVSLAYFSATTYFFWKLKHIGQSIGLPPDHIFFRFLDGQKFHLDLFLLVTTVCVVVLLSLWGLYLSNRVVGPLGRLKKYLEDFRDGKTNEPLTFREGDYFQDLPRTLNEAISTRCRPPSS
jgi:hypothetical protein